MGLAVLARIHQVAPVLVRDIRVVAAAVAVAAGTVVDAGAGFVAAVGLLPPVPGPSAWIARA